MGKNKTDFIGPYSRLISSTQLNISVLQTQYLTRGIQAEEGDIEPTLSVIWIQLQCLNTMHYSADKADKHNSVEGEEKKSNHQQKPKRKILTPLINYFSIKSPTCWHILHNIKAPSTRPPTVIMVVKMCEKKRKYCMAIIRKMAKCCMKVATIRRQ